jgi:hypothetical protein
LVPGALKLAAEPQLLSANFEIVQSLESIILAIMLIQFLALVTIALAKHMAVFQLLVAVCLVHQELHSMV